MNLKDFSNIIHEFKCFDQSDGGKAEIIVLTPEGKKLAIYGASLVCQDDANNELVNIVYCGTRELDNNLKKKLNSLKIPEHML